MSPAPSTTRPAPALFDFQVNGFGGVDFQQDGLTSAAWDQAMTALHRHGTARIFATLITDDVDRLCRRLSAMEAAARTSPLVAQTVAGYHLEGPWLCLKPGFRGAHPADPMHAPDVREFDRLQDAANGKIRLVTLAPEWPGSDGFIAHLASQRVHVALGHTDASEAQIDRAIRAGARFCTHLGNGVPLTLPRHDNVIQRLLARDELTACFIPDGVHVPDFVLRNFCRAKPAGKILFTTDAMAGAGAGRGTYTLGTLSVEVNSDGIARQPDGGGLAGSTLTPDTGVRRTAEILGLPWDAAFKLWSEAPVRAFGLPLLASADAS